MLKRIQLLVLLLVVTLSLTGASWLFVSGGPPPWDPTMVTTKAAWFKYDTKITSGSNVTEWTQKSTDLSGIGVSMTYGSNFPTVVSAALNGHDGLQYPLNSQKPITSPQDTVTVGASQAFTWAMVHKSPTLGTNTYYSINGAAGATTPDNIAVFYTNLTGLPVYYIQCGGTPTTVVSPTNFNAQAFHSIVVMYNGGGNYATAGNWKIYVNGVSQTVSTQTLSGGSAAINFFGDNATGGAPDAGITLEYIMAKEDFSASGGANLTGLLAYWVSEYGAL